MNEIATINNTNRMTSLEIAELTGKNHRDVMRDIRNLIDQVAIDERSFALVDYKDAKGEMRPMYELDFKATMTLVTGYDAKRRSMVIDRWVKLETGEVTPAYIAAQTTTAVPAAREFRALLSIAKMAGLKGNPAILSASQATRRLIGQDPLALIGATHLVAEEQARHFTPTELGMRLGGLSGKKFNRLLESAGLQELVPCGKHKAWMPTEAGRKYAVLLDTGKKNGDGAMVQQLKWIETVLSEVAA